MKNKHTLKDWLINPFRYIAGEKALIIGLAVLLLISVLSYYGNVNFGGALGGSIAEKNFRMDYKYHLLHQIVIWICMTIVFYIVARIVSKSSVRLIDIAGTLAMAQAPFILFAALGLIPSAHIELGNPAETDLQTINNVLKDNIVMLSIIGLAGIIIMVWSAVLKYKAFSTSANIKGGIGIASFFVGLIICEILSQVCNYLINKLL